MLFIILANFEDGQPALISAKLITILANVFNFRQIILNNLIRGLEKYFKGG